MEAPNFHQQREAILEACKEAESALVQLVEEGRLSSETAQAVSDQLQAIRNRASWLAPGEPDRAELLSQEIYQLTLHLDNPHFFND